MLPFFCADNEALFALLRGFGADVPAVLGARLEALDAETIDPLAARSAHERNQALRALLAEAIAALPPDATASRANIADYLRERIARDPSSGTRVR